MSKTAIEVKNVTKIYRLYDRSIDRIKDALSLTRKKVYKEHYALRDVSFSINEGETVGIIGTNGSGKSTILKIITGVLNPTEGEVVVNGRISALLELGAGFNMEYTGIENVYLNGTMIGFTKEEIDAKLDAILEFADIGDFVYQPVKTYSSGMFVRLAFAVAINIEPEILIVDEALSVGDVFFQAKCYKKFEEFKQMGKTIVFVSHDLSSISKYCDRVVLLNKGVKESEGTPKAMVNLFKKILVGQNKTVEEATPLQVESENALWKNAYQINPEVDEYGSGKATIVDFGVFDEDGNLTNCILKGTTFSIKSKVTFHEALPDPIFTYSFKDVKGTVITGSNTMYENAGVGMVHEGDTYVATFTQEMNLQGGDYFLSISCTGYGEDGFTAYHRLYDVINITVVSSKNTVGFYDMNSIAEVEKVD